jgi:radical SAM superfamily enzyme YgiQ (UPF0313 family)
MSIDILLTYPADGIRLFSSMIPSGLVSIGSVLQQHGYSVKIIDFNHYSDDFRLELLRLQPKIIGIGGTTTSRNGSFLTARIAKSILPESITVYGGPHASFTAIETLSANRNFDFVIRGEGEFSFLALCNKIIRKQEMPFQSVSGLSYRENGTIVSNKIDRIQDLSQLPIADRSLLPYNYPIKMDFINCMGNFIMTSRGCPAGCNFCAAAKMFPGGVRLRPMEQIAQEIELLCNQRVIGGLKLFDSTFTANKDHVYEFCSMIKKFRLAWECEIRADTVDSDMLQVMKNSGCYYINMGMETSNTHLLRKIGKGISPQQVLDVLNICKDIGIHTKVFFTFGHIGQTIEDCYDDIRFIEKHKKSIDFFAVTVGMRMYPGTRLEAEARQKGIIPDNFSWNKSSRTLSNILIGELGNVPVLFQKNLSVLAMTGIIIKLLSKRCFCTPEFLFVMAIQNLNNFGKMIKKQCKYSFYRLRRVILVFKFKEELVQKSGTSE